MGRFCLGQLLPLWLSLACPLREIHGIDFEFVQRQCGPECVEETVWAVGYAFCDALLMMTTIHGPGALQHGCSIATGHF
jgi:hypothetical protein